MSVSLHSMSISILSRTLTSLSGWLAKAEEHAKSQEENPDDYLGLKLVEDMREFSFQIQTVSDAAKRGAARLAEVEAPAWADDETTFAELRQRIAKTIEYVDGIAPAQLEGAETRTIEMQAGPDMTLTFTGENYVKQFVLPNFFFHATMTYALLRQKGVPLGKMDFLGPI